MSEILLGLGVFSVGGTAVGLTRGGGKFTVERDYRPIEADGDKGTVKDRVEIDREVAKLMLKGLQLFTPTAMKKYYPGMDVTPDNEETPTKYTMTSTLKIVAGDYNDVKWTGRTRSGKAVVINLESAINLSNLDWELQDKNEVVPELEFEATYDEDARDTPPWNVEYAVS